MQSIPGRSRLVAVLFRIALACLLTGCAAAPAAAPADSGVPPDAGIPDSGTPDAGPMPQSGTFTVIGRTVHFKVPTGYVPGHPAPLLIMFHGYGSNAVS